MNIKRIVLLGLLLMAATTISAQNREGGQRGNMGQFVEAEKKAVLERIETLNDEQKEVINLIYADYSESFTKLREEANGDFRSMMPKIQSLMEDKDKSMKALLTEEQYKEYTALLQELRQRRRRNQQ